MKRALTEPAIECHPKIRQIFSQNRELLFIGNVLELLQPLLFGQGEIAIPIPVNDALCCIDDVRTVIAVLWKYNLLSESFKIARIHRYGKQIHLLPRIVDIIFTLDLIACRTQQLHQCRANRRTASMSDVEGTRRIRTDVLYLYRRQIFRRKRAIVLPCTENVAQRICNHIFLEIEIKKAGTCHLCMIKP